MPPKPPGDRAPKKPPTKKDLRGKKVMHAKAGAALKKQGKAGPAAAATAAAATPTAPPPPMPPRDHAARLALITSNWQKLAQVRCWDVFHSVF